MTPDAFRRLALGLPEVTEGAHMEHPDFRVGGKIFATLGGAEAGLGMVKLTVEQQRDVTRSEPDIFRPVKGGWGRRGATHIVLRVASKASVMQALMTAWRNTAPKRLRDRIEHP